MTIEFDAGEGYALAGSRNVFTISQCAAGTWAVDDDNLGDRVFLETLNRAIDYCLNNDKEYAE